MKIRYNEDFDCYMTTECHKTDIIELDGVKLIPITELDKIKSEIHDMLISDEVKNDYWGNLIYNKAYLFINIIDKHIEDLKGEDNEC